jgi:hypothetical protein
MFRPFIAYSFMRNTTQLRIKMEIAKCTWKENGIHGNHAEAIAMSEIYTQPVSVYFVL